MPVPIWDLVVVTARTKQQRWLFEQYLNSLWPRSKEGVPAWQVLQDPPGAQLGTAGATLAALDAAARELGPRLAGARVLVLHCGGLSQRVPQLAHVGKAFAPGAGPDQEATLFAQVVEALGRLFAASEPGVVIACGDVRYTAEAQGRVCRRDEAVALATPAPPEQASRHGVYLWETNDDRVSEAWQKSPAERLREVAGDREWGMDTGILYLGAGVVGALLEVIGHQTGRHASTWRQGREWRGLELYRDLTPAMTRCWQERMCLPGAPGAVQRTLARFPLHVVCPQGAVLLHFGTNEELMQILATGGEPRLHASCIAGGDFGPGVVLDRCLVDRPIHVGAGSYVSGLNRPAHELCIGAGRVVYQLPLRNGVEKRGEGFVALGVGDDARQSLAEGAILLGEPLKAWLRELGVTPAEVWNGVPESEQSLWNARLFPVGEADTVAGALPWLTGTDGPEFGRRVDRWRRAPRTSMLEAQQRFDARRWWAHEQRIRAHRLADALTAAVCRGDGADVRRFLEASSAPEGVRRLVRQRLEQLGRGEAATLIGARAWLVASRLATDAGAAGRRSRGFRSLGRALTADMPPAMELCWALAPGESVEAQAPVRVDLVGGWTDTPPQACERGGCVLNLSLLLDGRRPLAARVERLAEPVVELVARDLGACRTLDEALPARQPFDPGDPFALHQAGLRLVGLFSGGPLRRRLERLGGGLRITTEAAVPKGSGLGTSSILGATLLAGLYRAFGQDVLPDELCLRVLQLEQLMGTGGGWQDQVGGMWGGVKFARSASGVSQHPEVEVVRLGTDREVELEERMVLFYTGEPRLAKDVLQRVVGRYLVGEPATVAALEAMPALAARARASLVQGDWAELGRCLDRSWMLNRQVEPTCTNDSLDALFGRIAPFVLGAKLAGAGGGGFLFALARDRAARERLESLLTTVPAPARLYRATLDREGLVVAQE
jgi:fucokinase